MSRHFVFREDVGEHGGGGVTFGALFLDLWYDMRALAGDVLLL